MGTYARLGPCGRLVIHLDLFCVFWGCSGLRHFSRGVVHQSSMSSYTLSSKGRADDGCILWREYLSWRRSPTSLMILKACGDIYTIKKLSTWRAICGWRKFKGAPSQIFIYIKEKLSCKTESRTWAEIQKTTGLIFPIFSYYLSVRWSHRCDTLLVQGGLWVHTDMSSKHQPSAGFWLKLHSTHIQP